jgi:hypothetical protein
VFTLSTCALAWDEPKKDSSQAQGKSSQVEEQFKTLEKELQVKQREYFDQLHATKEDQARKALFKGFQGTQNAFARKALDLAFQNPKAAITLKILAKAVTTANDPSLRKEIMKTILDYHAVSPGIGKLAMDLASGEDPPELEFVEALLARNKIHDEQGKILFAVGMMKRQKAGQEALSDDERTKCIADAKQLFAKLKAGYVDVGLSRGRTLATVADGALVGLENIPRLLAGKEAPEIEGEDLDGKSFKLSDYRGKVVMLDYWAHW